MTQSSSDQVDGGSEVWKLFRARITIGEMLRDRGYVFPSDTIQPDLTTFKRVWGEQPNRREMKITATRGSEYIYVYFPEFANRVGIAPIREYVEEMVSRGVRRGIVVLRNGLTSMARQSLDDMRKHIMLEQFDEDDLINNVSKHELVPTHTLLSGAEKAALLSRYHLKETQLPRILATDPVARYYGFSRGQVVRITRASDTAAGSYITYRLVC